MRLPLITLPHTTLPLTTIPLSHTHPTPSLLIPSLFFSSPLLMTVARMLVREGSIETLVVSIAGTPPSEKDWGQLFTRMTCKQI